MGKSADHFQIIADEEAILLVDEVLGRAPEWNSPLIRYRLSAEFQADWKAEVGHWLHTARILGFLDELVQHRLCRAYQGEWMESARPDPNDQLHRILQHELAPAMAVHYLKGCGWSLNEFEPDLGPGIDIDISMISPGGKRVDAQVKAPDQPGRASGFQLVDGEDDEHVKRSVCKAAEKQLPRIPESGTMIIVAPQRTFPMGAGVLSSMLMGTTSQFVGGNEVVLFRRNLGLFFSSAWSHVGCVLHLHLARGPESRSYGSEVWVNPNALPEASVDRTWFPFSRVLYLENDAFHWAGGVPPYSFFADGTKIVADEWWPKNLNSRSQ